MVQPTLRPSQGRLTYDAVFDLRRMTTEHDRAAAVADLTAYGSLCRPGSRVTLRVADLCPYDCGSRVPAFVADALAAGVNIRLDGEPHALRAWWEYLHEATTPRRHLRTVK